MTPLIIVVVAVVVFALWLVGAFNGLVRARNRVKESWSDIDVQLKRRHDLIPNLVETVKGYAAHESQVFDAGNRPVPCNIQTQTAFSIFNGKPSS